jgi:hypothetical protein
MMHLLWSSDVRNEHNARRLIQPQVIRALSNHLLSGDMLRLLYIGALIERRPPFLMLRLRKA